MRKKELFIVGTGGFAKEIAFILEYLKEYRLIGFVSNEKEKGEKIFKNHIVVANDQEIFEKWGDKNFFVAIGDIALRKNVVNKYKSNGVEHFPSLIHPLSLVSTDVHLNEGVVIYPGSKVMPNVSIGVFCVVNANVFIGHDSCIGDFVNLNPYSIINGNVKIGDNVLVGANSVLHQGLTISDNIKIGIGSVIVKNLENEGTYFGNPARILL